MQNCIVIQIDFGGFLWISRLDTDFPSCQKSIHPFSVTASPALRVTEVLWPVPGCLKVHGLRPVAPWTGRQFFTTIHSLTDNGDVPISLMCLSVGCRRRADSIKPPADC